jgi:hypothetical protein
MSHNDLRALFLNCTLKKSPERSRTQGLIELGSRITKTQGVQVEHLQPIDDETPTGVWAGHDRARLADRRVAVDLPACDGRRHPRHRRADLTG